MAVLKDVFCAACGSIAEAFLDRDATQCVQPCLRCGLPTTHESRCTGGCRLKAYVCTYDGRDWSGDVEYLGRTACEYEDGTPYLEGDGSYTPDKMAATARDRVGERREIMRHKQREMRGTGRVFIDSARRQRA
jgi:hypothetical protein